MEIRVYLSIRAVLGLIFFGSSFISHFFLILKAAVIINLHSTVSFLLLNLKYNRLNHLKSLTALKIELIMILVADL